MLWKSSVFSFLLFFSLDSQKHLSVRSDKDGVQRWPCARDPLRPSPRQPRFHSGSRWASRGPAESHGEGPRCSEKRLVQGDASGFETIFSGAAGVLLYCASLLLAFKETLQTKVKKYCRLLLSSDRVQTRDWLWGTGRRCLAECSCCSFNGIDCSTSMKPAKGVLYSVKSFFQLLKCFKKHWGKRFF